MPLKPPVAQRVGGIHDVASRANWLQTVRGRHANRPPVRGHFEDPLWTARGYVPSLKKQFQFRFSFLNDNEYNHGGHCTAKARAGEVYITSGKYTGTKVKYVTDEDYINWVNDRWQSPVMRDGPYGQPLAHWPRAMMIFNGRI